MVCYFWSDGLLDLFNFRIHLIESPQCKNDPDSDVIKIPAAVLKMSSFSCFCCNSNGEWQSSSMVSKIETASGKNHSDA